MQPRPVSIGPPAGALPLVGELPPERADAARNRARILQAAQCLVAEHGAERVTMEAVAAAASVGKGTVFRRFGDRAGLMLALLDHAEQDYQRAFISGPPPLGPGAPPFERLLAFGAATLRQEIRYRDLFLAAERTTPDRHTNDARQARAAHVSMLLRAHGTRGDLELLTEVLLGYLDIGTVDHLHTRRGMTLERLEAGWEQLITKLSRGL